MTARRVVRIIGILAGIVTGLEYSLFILSQTRFGAPSSIEIPLLCMLAGAIFGFFGLEYVTIRPFDWMESKLRATPLPDLASAIGGLAIGLVMAALVAYFLRNLPYELNIVVSAALALLFGYWGITLGLGRRDEILALLRGQPLERSRPTLLDTSVVIDGRIVDIAKTGFITNRLIAPHFMLVELQMVADSSDSIRRQRGRRGLEILDEMKRLPNLHLEFTDTDFPDVVDVDHKLIRLAKEVNGSILTTDYNLNRVASLEGVTTLNINDLANSLKPAVVPGEELIVTPLKEGKEHNQGVAYLSDGTMVVVEGGRHRLNEQVPVSVTSVIQTAAGRMIFAAVSGATPRILPVGKSSEGRA
ncbi:MAG: PIN domain nuclease [Candidatus Dormibacteraeota bacterium]|nr:PIN domain nuclease [Candidatus Dormibacteraeota bacterium]